jgi:hypothetical protein
MKGRVPFRELLRINHGGDLPTNKDQGLGKQSVFLVLVLKLLPKFFGYNELRNAKNKMETSEHDKKQTRTVVAEVTTEPDQGHAQ